MILAGPLTLAGHVPVVAVAAAVRCFLVLEVVGLDRLRERVG
ncbi:MAG TPA: hypothetical protein VMS64_29080 [Candidatus Methylomirabilis sp.]|nr:hypothetical protein [Candidatus Methylomirabilis sp.]